MSNKPLTPDKPSGTTRPRRNIWLKALKVVLITAICLLTLLIATLGIAVWILTPGRLTPLVNRVATEQVNAEVITSRVELTFWSTFPRLTLDIDSLNITSHSLKGLDESTARTLPQGADSLMSIGGIYGGIDVLSLLTGKIRLYDAELRSPRLNIVQVDSLTSNYNIFAPSAPDETKKESKIPDISINRFSITGGFPIDFTSLADSISAHATIASSTLTGSEAPVYTIKIDGYGNGSSGAFSLPRTSFGLNGAIEWEAAHPEALRASGMTISANNVAITFDAAVELSDTLSVNEFKVAGHDIKISDAISLIPSQYRGELAKIDTDLRASISAEILAPYTPADGKIPPVAVALNIPKGSLNYEQVHLSGIEAEVNGTINAETPDRSRIEIKKLAASGKAVDVRITGTVEHPASDPQVEGTFDGRIDFSRLPAKLMSRLPATISGTLSGKADFKLRQSYLTAKQFHKIKLNGELDLRNFNARMNDGTAQAYTRHAHFKLGTSSSVKVDGQSVDSLLTASLTIDTVSAGIPGMTIAASDMQMGVGSRNISTSSDTSRINPMGASIRTHRLTLQSDSDSIRLRITDAMIRASLQRYNSDAKSPLLKLNLDMERLRISDKYNRMSLRKVSSSLTLHPKRRPKMSRRMQQAYDSIAALHPSLSSDSIKKLTLRTMRRQLPDKKSAETAEQRERIDFGIDNSLRSWLRLWHLEGNVTARRARLFTPYFPVHNTIKNLDFRFSTDSITIRDTQYKMGKSDFTINGTVSDISRALTSRRGAPLKMELDVACDTLNINEITRAMMMGSAFTERLKNGTAHMSDSDNDDVLSASIDGQVDANDRAAILIPTNITADISVRANIMKYADLTFNRFTGNVEAFDGAVHLKKLSAATSMGSFGMTALYSAPTKADIRFAGGIIVKRLDLRQFLDILPEIDTIMPMLGSMEGIITAECALTTQLDTLMNLKFHTLDMVLKLSGDSLVVLDSETFRKLSKWLMFKNKNRNMIDSMSVEMLIRNNKLQLYPFMVTLDRYRFGVSGSNDAALNLNYHVAVLKSPLPFKFGVNIKGTPEKMKIRLGRAKLNENEIASSHQITDTARINLIKEIQQLFRAGVRSGKDIRLSTNAPKQIQENANDNDTISHADSVLFIREGVIPKPAGWIDPDSIAAATETNRKKAQKKKR